jgi:hypothetical protein
LEAAAAEADAEVVPAGSDDWLGGEVPNRDAEETAAYTWLPVTDAAAAVVVLGPHPDGTFPVVAVVEEV